jgi:hypothetical protein
VRSLAEVLKRTEGGLTNKQIASPAGHALFLSLDRFGPVRDGLLI